MNKRYKLRGLIVGLIFGISISVVYQGYDEFSNLVGINTKGNTSSCTSQSIKPAPGPVMIPSCISIRYSSSPEFIQILYAIPVLLFSNIFNISGDIRDMLLGWKNNISGMFVVTIVYALLGFLVGLLYQKYKNKKYSKK